MDKKSKMIKEFELITMIQKFFPTQKSVLKGIGDDCAVLEKNKEEVLLISIDTLVQDVHFTFEELNFYDIGRKTAAVSLSDIAAMGGVPQTMLLSMTVIDGLSNNQISAFYKGIFSVNSIWNVALIGGDTVKGSSFSASSVVLGSAKKTEVVYRSGAKHGDWICVTGFLGGSRKRKHYSFRPKIDEARFLARNHIASAMIDLSDGISGDLRHILKESSQTGAVLFVKNIPLSLDALLMSQEKALQSALCDGEDFELLFTCSPSQKFILQKLPFFCSMVGYIDRRIDGLILRSNNLDCPISLRGFEHEFFCD